jgi:hypothetical protein
MVEMEQASDQQQAECCRRAFVQGWRCALEAFHRLRFEHDWTVGRAYSACRDYARIVLGGAPPGGSVPDVFAWREAQEARMRGQRGAE